MSNVSREMEILRKKQKEIPKIKNTVTEMKNAFHGLISRLDKAEERISALKGMSTEISKIEKQKRLGVKKKKETEYLTGTNIIGVTYTHRECQKEKKGRKEQMEYLRLQ